MPDVLLGIGIVAGLTALTVVGARRQRTGHPIWGWVAQVPVLLGPAAMIGTSVWLIAGGQLVGILLLAFGLVLGYSQVRHARTASQRVRESAPGELSDAAANQMADYALIRVGIMLISGIVLGIALVIWAIAERFD